MSFWDGTRWVEDVPATTAPPPRRRGRRFLGAAAEAVLVTALIFGLVASTTLAAKGGNGGKPSDSPPATLAASCDPCALGVTAFTGSGFDASQSAAQLWVSGAGSAIPVYEDGTVAFSWYFSVPTTYEVRLYQQGKGRHKMKLMAQTFVTVTE